MSVLSEGIAYVRETDCDVKGAQPMQQLALLGDRIIDLVLAERVVEHGLYHPLIPHLRSNKQLSIVMRRIAGIGTHGSTGKRLATEFEAAVGVAYLEYGLGPLRAELVDALTREVKLS